jgi:hypothetical protein
VITTELAGGMGNQLFRYSVGRAQAMRLGTELNLGLSYFQGKNSRPFTLDQWAGVTVRSVAPTGGIHAHEGNLGIPQEFPKQSEAAVSRTESAKRVRELPDGSHFSGCWESEKYFSDIADTLRKEFVPKRIEFNGLGAARYIAQEKHKSAFICIRRTDYVTEGRCLPLEYYKEAVRRVAAVEPDPHFFVFSDDASWVLNNLQIPYRMTVLRAYDLNPVLGTGREAEDIWLMSLCKNAVVSNSTFAWWGAWLNRDPGVIVSPKWNYTEVPDTWVRI